LYFLTTLYVDVKEPALAHIQATKKLNLVADSDRPALARLSGRDKIESNLQSQMYVERTPGLEESRGLAGSQPMEAGAVVNRQNALFFRNFSDGWPLGENRMIRHAEEKRVCLVNG
jgi:hypothetical protein